LMALNHMGHPHVRLTQTLCRVPCSAAGTAPEQLVGGADGVRVGGLPARHAGRARTGAANILRADYAHGACIACNVA